MLKLAAFGLAVTLPVTLGVMVTSQPQPQIEVAVDGSEETESLFVDQIFAPGRVEGVTPEVDLRSQATGRVIELLVADGQTVHEGDLLLRIDDAQLRCDLEIAAADVELAEAQLERLENGARSEDRAEAAALYHVKLAEYELARADWERSKPLYERKVITTQEAERYRTNAITLRSEVAAAKARYERVIATARPDEIRIAKARILAAKARLEETRVLLNQTHLKAPSTGQILKVNVEVGELVGPDSAQPVIVMVDTSRYRVRAFVEELDAPRVIEGMAARIVADGLPGQEFTGHVSHVSPRMSPKIFWTDKPGEKLDTKVREICIELPESDSLVVGLPVDAYIDTRPEQPVESTPCLEQQLTSAPARLSLRN